MRALLHTKAATGGLQGIRRLHPVLFAIIQTSIAAGLAWYIGVDLFRHPAPFFAPVAAAVCLSASTVLRAQRAVQMMIGVTLGIGVGAAVHQLLGYTPTAVGVGVLVALCLGVLIGHGFIGQGLTFVNQAAISAILVITLSRYDLVFWERLHDAFVGGALALVFSVLLFPANPLTVLRAPRLSVLRAVHYTLAQTADIVADRTSVAPDWPWSAVDRVHAALGEFIGARATARQVVRFSPRRWQLREAFQGADHQAVHVALLAGSVLQLARVVAPETDGRRGWRPHPVPAVLADLAAAIALADSDPAGACAYTAAARHHASALHAQARERTDVVLADVVQACIDDLQRVIDLRQP
jgi:uncharacterized membrane protein YgaE (UPF0421/DUF939 family)